MTEERRLQVQDIVTRVVRSRYPETDFAAIRAWPDLDHDGDPVLRVEILFRPEDEELRCKMGLGVGLIGDIQDHLCAVGETRFPLPRFLRADDARD